jgi:hypothetical protein
MLFLGGWTLQRAACKDGSQQAHTGILVLGSTQNLGTLAHTKSALADGQGCVFKGGSIISLLHVKRSTEISTTNSFFILLLEANKTYYCPTKESRRGCLCTSNMN